MRSSQAYLLAGLGAVALAATASAIGLPSDKPQLKGTVNTFLGRPVVLDADAQRALTRRVASFNGACMQSSRVPEEPEFAPLLDAVAATRCERTGAGAQTITSFRFRSADQIDAYFAALRRTLRGGGGACDGGAAGITAWATRAGRLAGRILCYAGEDSFFVAWTEGATHTQHIAEGPNSNKLLEWWQRAMRPLGRYPSEEESDLLDIVDSRVDTKHCARDRAGGSPMARAAIACDVVPGVPDRAATVFFELHAPKNLDRYLRDVFSDPTLDQIPQVDMPCRRRSLERGSWETTGRGTLGTLACRPRGNRRVLFWTLDDAGLFGYLNAFEVSGPASLYRIWLRGLRGVGS